MNSVVYADGISGGLDAGSVPGDIAKTRRDFKTWATVQRIITDSISALLLAAAALKLESFAFTPTLPNPPWTDEPSVIVSELILEVVVALWLVTQHRRRWALTFAMVLFSLFASITGYDLASHRASCGCFGRVPVHPGITLSLDGCVLLALAAAWRSKTLDHSGRSLLRWRAIAAGSLGMLAFASLLAAIWFHPQPSAALLDLNGPLVMLEPERWVKQPFPLLGHIVGLNQESALTVGRWTVVLYHHNCPTCQREVNRALKMADPEHRVVLIELPPLDPMHLSPIAESPDRLFGQLEPAKEWFATTPVVLHLEDGVVVDQTSGENIPSAKALD